MNYAEIYKRVMPEKKEREERFNIFAHYVGRPLSILMTIPLIERKTKPTTITKFSLASLIVGFILVAFGNSTFIRIIGWLFFFIWNLLDGVDGNLARCTNQCSQNGDLWDTTVGYCAMIATYYSAGIAAFYDRNLFSICGSHWYIIFGGYTAIIAILPRLVLHKKKSSCGDSDSVRAFSNKEGFGIKEIIAMNFISPSGFMQVIFLSAIMLHTLSIYTIVYAVINTAIMVITLYRLLEE